MEGDSRNATFDPARGPELSYAEALREVAVSTKDLVLDEIKLVTAEVKESGRKASRHVTQAVVFGALLAVSILPLLAFFVIALGQLMGHRYWLSSLLVALVCAGVGGVMAYRAFVKLKNEDLVFPATRSSLSYEKDLIQNKVEDVKQAAKGERHGSNRSPRYT